MRPSAATRSTGGPATGTWACECSECGNGRPLLGNCPHCGSLEVPTAHKAYLVLNLEYGHPGVEVALARFHATVCRAAEVGLQGLIVVHGYGSSGAGGGIRRALRAALNANTWADRIADYLPGEDLGPHSAAYAQLVQRRPAVRAALHRGHLGNSGITLILMARELRRSHR